MRFSVLFGGHFSSRHRRSVLWRWGVVRFIVSLCGLSLRWDILQDLTAADTTLAAADQHQPPEDPSHGGGTQQLGGKLPLAARQQEEPHGRGRWQPGTLLPSINDLFYFISLVLKFQTSLKKTKNIVSTASVCNTIQERFTSLQAS